MFGLGRFSKNYYRMIKKLSFPLRFLVASFLLVCSLFELSAQDYYQSEIDGVFYQIGDYSEIAVVVGVDQETLASNLTILSTVTCYKYDSNGTVVDSKTAPVTIIADQAFYDCTGLKSVTIANSITKIGEKAFWGCYNLESVLLGESVSTICKRAFENCSSISSLIIPNNVTVIDEYAFFNCKGINSLTIGESVEVIGKFAFSGSTNSNMEPNIKVLIWNAENCNSNGNMKTRNIEEVIIGEQVRLIPSNFVNGSKINEVSIPSLVEQINQDAFEDCNGLKELTWNAKQCGTRGNMPTSGIVHVKIGDEVELLPNRFVSSSKISEVTIPASVKTIGDYAFSSCAGLTVITIPKSTTFIGNGAFSNCTGLETLYWNAEDCGFHFSTFEDVSYYYSAFDGDNISQVVFDADVKRIYFHDDTQWHYLTGGLFWGAIIDVVISHAAVPPVFDFYGSMEFLFNVPLFSSTTYEDAELIVPTGSVGAYREAEGWKDFYTIKDTDNTGSFPGDLNGDGEIGVADINTLIDIILANIGDIFYDMNGDGEVTIADLTMLIDLFLSKH